MNEFLLNHSWTHLKKKNGIHEKPAISENVNLLMFLSLCKLTQFF